MQRQARVFEYSDCLHGKQIENLQKKQQVPVGMHEEIEDDRGYRFYINKTTNIKYKENPSLILIIKRIKANLKDVKFCTYRSAVKLIQLKNSLFSKSSFLVSYYIVMKFYADLIASVCLCHFSLLYSFPMCDLNHNEAQSWIFTRERKPKPALRHHSWHLLRQWKGGLLHRAQELQPAFRHLNLV